MAKVTLLRMILAGITDLERAIKKHLATHPKAPLLAALPDAGQISLAQLLAELGPILDRASSADQAAAEAGATPVTRTSGKTSSVRFRMGRQPQRPPSPARLRRQRPTRLTMGRQAVCRRPRPRQAPPPSHPHPRPCLAAGHLGLLAHQHPLRPRQTPRRTTPHRSLT
jgi:hypothetical protein